MKTIIYRGHTITRVFPCSFVAHTGRYGIVEEKRLEDVKKLIDNSIALR
jgi:hypothetical protein